MAERTCPPLQPNLSFCPDRRRLIGAAATLLLLPVWPTLGQAATILAVRTWPAEEYTRVTFEIDSELKTEHFVLDHPDRLVVDIEGLTLTQTLHEIAAKVRPDDPYIQSLRVAQNRPNVVRLVFDLKQAIAPQIFTLKPIADYQYRLVLDLYPKVTPDPLLAILKMQESAPLDKDDPLALILEDIARHPITPDPSASSLAHLSPLPPLPDLSPQTAPPSRISRPHMITIALDPGHGGEDPGAVGKTGLREKDVVLRIGHRLKALIDAQPNMRAFLTRDGDYFVPLHVRVQKARRARADLFISIHADAWVKSSASGSSVFALSQRGASSAQARWMANKENEADLIGGINLGKHDQHIAQVLLDLSTTAQINDSMRVGSAFLNEIRKINRLHKNDVEQAGFAVLKAPDIPSILVETAFISNPQEEALLKSHTHQDKLAVAMLNGIRRYFSSYPSLARRD